jgi:pyruvate formate-lyase/glycerol dehydratase family glycyl radical enzyme
MRSLFNSIFAATVGGFPPASIEYHGEGEIIIMTTRSIYNPLTGMLLRLMALQFNYRPSLKRYLKSTDGWINFTVGFRTETGTVEKAIIFYDGRVSVSGDIPADVDVVMRFASDDTLKEMLGITPNEMLSLIMKNKMILDGNMTYLQLFNFYVSLLLGKKHQKMLEKTHREDMKSRKREYSIDNPELSKELLARKKYRMKGEKNDAGVKFLEDPYLSRYSLDDFPRLRRLCDMHFGVMPELCAERPRILTEWYRTHGFEYDEKGDPWVPELRQAHAFKYLMEERKPIIAEDSLIAGTSTSKEPTGVLIYPDSSGTLVWGELETIERRILNPYKVSREDAEILHDVFSFWARRNFKQWVREKYEKPLCLQIDERWVYYFVWKSVGISHTIPDYPRVLRKGTEGIIRDIEERLKRDDKLDGRKRDALEAMAICLEGVNAYAKNLSGEAERRAAKEANPERKGELLRLSEICEKVPQKPAETLDEAINVVWIVWVALHMENTNTGLSFGRLDQWLQPYFESDMEKLSSSEEKCHYIEKAIELVGCLFMRGTDHLPLVPDIGNYLFGGSSSDQAITLGGVTPEGEDGVNDMTYIFLKVTEMLGIRDPNVNARFNPEKNSDTYLKRLCEVNFITAATPSMHNDHAVFASLKNKGYAPEDIRNWSATGCVEPTLSGNHMSHTGSILMNLVSALEMALNNGRHPTMDWNLGPETGSVEKGDFSTFEDFFEAYKIQLRFLIDQAAKLNRMYAEAHAEHRPTPLISALIDGSIEKGMDVTRGGATYNTSGSSNIGLVDVTDSLMVIKKLVFDEKKVTFSELKCAIDANFADTPKLHAMVQKGTPLFGSGNGEALAMARRVAKCVHDCYEANENFRGGKYSTGFWSMSQHVAYGNLSGALPSGRLAGKAFTPGLTPHPSASNNFLDNIRDVASLEAEHMDNNEAFNVKLVPSPHDSREDIITIMHSYVKNYFEEGGMQMQFNVVNSDVLRDAMANPENYRNLLVRISGYNAYFVTLNKEMQIELIERAEFGM